MCGFIYRFVEVYHFLDGLGSPGWGVSSHVLPSASGHGGLGMSSEYAFFSVSG